eukprot:jgi/Mesen1/9947/ME000071S09364
MNGRPMRIMWSHRDPSARKSGVGNIFIKNLDESIDNKALHDTFIAFGPILSCKIASTEGKSKGYGFVHFDTEEAANLAIEKVNGMLLEGRKVFVGKFLKKSERDETGAVSKFTNIYVKNLDTDVTEEALKEKFETFGSIANLIVMRDESGNSKGFGFVNYDNPDSAQAAVEAMEGAQFGSKTLFVGRAMKKAERERMLRQQFEEKRIERMQKYQGVNLYIKNLDDAVDQDQIKAEFSPYGTITSAKIMKNEKGGSKGFGFVCFSTPEEAAKAVSEVHGRMINGKPIYVALAQRKEDRRVQLEQVYAQRLPGMPLQPGVVTLPAGTPVGPPMYAGAPMFYAGPPGVMAGPGQLRPGMMYQQQPVMARTAWRAAGPVPRPGFQPAPNHMGPGGGGRGQRQRQQRPNGQGQQQQANGGTVNANGPHAPLQNGHSGPAYNKDGPRSNAQRQPMKYAPNSRAVPNGHVAPPQVVPGAAAVPNGVVVPAAPIMMVPVVAAPATPVAIPAPTDVLTSTMLAAAPPAQQKQILGERLFPLVHQKQPELAGKVTGMLLEMDNSELLLLLESPEALVAKVDEALLVLGQHGPAAAEDVEAAPATAVAAQ